MSEHYYTESPTSEIKEIAFESELKGQHLAFRAVSGVFSFEPRIDKASALLIEAFEPSGAAASLLDVGCGFGAIGLTLKAAFPALEAVLTDVNRRAVTYSLLNAERNHLHVTALAGSLYEPVVGRKFGDIVSNPPFAAGKATCFRLIDEAYEHLAVGGALWLTAFHNKGGEGLSRHMELIFGNVEDVEKAGGMRVYRSVFRG